MKRRSAGSRENFRQASIDQAWRQFERGLERMSAYIAKHGHSYPSERERALILWSRRMRYLHGKGQLDVDRQTYLKRIGFDLEKHPGFNRWHQQYVKFKKYWLKRPATRSCRIHEDEMPEVLRLWLTMNRVARNRGLLHPRREQLLDELGVDWHPFENHWNESYTAVVRYIKRTKTKGRLPLDIPEGKWLDQQITRICDGTLSDERVKRIHSLGIDLNPILNKRRAVIDAVRAFHAQHGHANIPERSRSPKRDELMAWVRKRYASGDLSPGVVKELKKLRFAWVGPDHDKVVTENLRAPALVNSAKHWDRRIKQLRTFVEKYGRLPRLADSGTGRTLHYFIERIKGIMRDPDHKLTYLYKGERRRTLEELGVVFTKKPKR